MVGSVGALGMYKEAFGVLGFLLVRIMSGLF